MLLLKKGGKEDKKGENISKYVDISPKSEAFNPYHAKFLKCNNPPYIFSTFHYYFRDIKIKT